MSLRTMRAAVLREPGKELTVREVQIREPARNEVLVRTARVGICGTDLHFATGRVPHSLPTVLGHEAAGIVEQTGPGVTTVEPGDRVLVCDQMPCGRCAMCLSGKMVYCTDMARKERQNTRLSIDGAPFRQYLGVSGLAELMLVDESGVIPMTDGLSFDAAALLGCCLTTGTASIFNTARLRPGQSALIIGCGGVGLSAVQAARIAGAAVIIAADPEEHRRQAAVSLGATCAIDPSVDDIHETVRKTTMGRGVDIAVEVVGDPALATTAFEALAPAGRAIVIGMMPPGSQISIPSALLRYGCSIAGTSMGEVRTAQDIPAYQRLIANGQLRADELATDCWPLEEVNAAFSHAAARRGIRTMISF